VEDREHLPSRGVELVSQHGEVILPLVVIGQLGSGS